MRSTGNTKKQKKNGTQKKKKTLEHFPQYFPSESEKEIICKKLNRVSEEDITTEYFKLRNMSCVQIKNQSAETRIGNNIVDFFTLKERLHTKGNQQVDFYTFWKNKDHFKQVPYVRKMLDYYKTRDTDEIRKFKYIFNLYFSSISIFRPIMAMELYCKVNATRVLDFTMGWGGRLVAAHVLNIESYIGIDINSNLSEPYNKMVTFLRKRENEEITKKQTTIQLIFKDALQVDYSKLDYDTVFTSPPYFDLEEYRMSKKYSTQIQCIEEFYHPIINVTWKYLKQNGHYCLNVPEEMYHKVCVPLLGKCHFKLALKKKKRTKTAKYKEFIYIWKKV